VDCCSCVARPLSSSQGHSLPIEWAQVHGEDLEISYRSIILYNLLTTDTFTDEGFEADDSHDDEDSGDDAPTSRLDTPDCGQERRDRLMRRVCQLPA